MLTLRDVRLRGGVRVRASVIILLVAGIVSVGLGFAFVAASTVPQSRNTSFQLPMGQYYYTYLRFEILTAGTITVTYQASPGAVDQYVLTQAQYAVFQTYATTDTLFSMTGSSGSFTASLPSGGTYYLVTTHAVGYEATPQSGIHSTTVTGIVPTPFHVALIAFATGLVLLVIGLWLRTKPAHARLPTYSPYAFGIGVQPAGGSIGPAQVPAAGPTFAPHGYGTVLVTVENPSVTDANVPLFINGLLVTSLLLPAGKNGQATLHPGLSNPYGTPVRIEAVAADGRRASREVTATTAVAVPIGFRLQ